MHLRAVRLKVDRGDEGALSQVRVEEGAVVVVGAAARWRLGGVRRRGFQMYFGHRRLGK